MPPPEMEGAAIRRDADCGPENRTASRLVDAPENSCDGRDDQAEWPVPFCPIELRALELEPIVCNPVAFDRLRALGVPGEAMNGDGPADALASARVHPLPNGRFAFVGEAFGGDGWRDAAVVLCRDENGDAYDLAALSLESGRVLTWRGAASMLGAENVFAPRVGGEPLAVRETALDWLRAGRAGVFIIDPQRAAPLLRRAGPLGVHSAAFGRRLQEALTIAPPRILVASPARAAA